MTESEEEPVHCLQHFISIIAKHSCPAALAKAYEAVETPANQLAWHVLKEKSNVSGSAFVLSTYLFTFLSILLP